MVTCQRSQPSKGSIVNNMKFYVIYSYRPSFVNSLVRAFDAGWAHWWKGRFGHCGLIFMPNDGNVRIFDSLPSRGVGSRTFDGYFEGLSEYAIIELTAESPATLALAKANAQRYIDEKRQYDQKGILALFLRALFGTAPHLQDSDEFWCDEFVISLAIDACPQLLGHYLDDMRAGRLGVNITFKILSGMGIDVTQVFGDIVKANIEQGAQ
jgi:hypothetical protein